LLTMSNELSWAMMFFLGAGRSLLYQFPTPGWS
jgi:hypothetical protein